MTSRSISHKGHDITVGTNDDGSEPSVVVDGEPVPVDLIEGGYAVAYLPPTGDLVAAVRAYADRLAPRGGEHDAHP